MVYPEEEEEKEAINHLIVFSIGGTLFLVENGSSILFENIVASWYFYDTLFPFRAPPAPPAIIIPEKTINPSIEEEKGGSLDFFINGQKSWAIELVRLGTQTSTKEHLSCFHPKARKYRKLCPKRYLAF